VRAAFPDIHLASGSRRRGNLTYPCCLNSAYCCSC